MQKKALKPKYCYKVFQIFFSVTNSSNISFLKKSERCINELNPARLYLLTMQIFLFMNNKKLPAFERLIIFISLLSFGMLLYRCIFSLSLHYTFFLWNLLVAFVPYIVSKQLLKCKTFNLNSFLLLSTWLVFFPACIYLFTDLMQIHKTDFPLWYDILMFSGFAFLGLLSGLMSLKQVEFFLKQHAPNFFVKVSVIFFIFLSSYSICLVRFLHLKSWNVIADSKRLLHASEHNIIDPQDHAYTWLTILLIVLLVDVLYAGFKKLYRLKIINPYSWFN